MKQFRRTILRRGTLSNRISQEVLMTNLLKFTELAPIW